ncbi:MAG: HlyC/CorC family transporter, partial [Rhizobacter sp.]|nr:HlyC/CorC family transporter [Chlorobiales bacterium]
MISIGFELAIIVVLVFLNGVFSLSELAIVSARKGRLQQLANEGNKRAAVALELANAPNDFLSTVQIGITLIGILTGAFGGAAVAKYLAAFFNTIPATAAYSDGLGVTLVVIPITYLSLVIGELVPKRLALTHPEAIACIVAPPMKWLSKIARPLVLLLSGSTSLLMKLLRVQAGNDQAVTEEEIKVLIDQGTQAGTFHAAEQDMIARVFRLADRHVAVLMTPRTDIIWLDLSESEAETKQKIAEHAYSFFPVATDTLDDLKGVVRGKDLLSLTMEGKPFVLTELCIKPLFIVETTPALRVLESFKKSGTHIAFVVNEHGTIQGLVTFDDILRSVFEDIEDTGTVNADIAERGDGSWLISGSLPLDEFADALEIGKLTDEDRSGMNTLGGFVMAKIGVVPTEGEHFNWRGLRFEVVDMDDRRVDKILV